MRRLLLSDDQLRARLEQSQKWGIDPAWSSGGKVCIGDMADRAIQSRWAESASVQPQQGSPSGVRPSLLLS